MIRQLDGTPLTNQSQGLKLPSIYLHVLDRGESGIVRETDAGDEVRRTTSSAVSRGSPIVFIVDDDRSARKVLETLIREARWQWEIFESAQEFLCRGPVHVPSCLVINIALANTNGFNLQKRLSTDRKGLPIIFVTDHDDIAMTVQAMKAGAFDFLTKPFRDDALLGAMHAALDYSSAVLAHEAEIRGLRERYACLSSREREVMALVVSGRLNKQAGFELGISEITVKAHRGKLMRKMGAGSLADLVKMALKLHAGASLSA